MTRWHLLVTRRIGIQVAQQWNHAFWKMEKPYGIGILRIRIESDGKKADYFVDDAQWRRFDAGMRKKLGQKTFTRRFARDAKSFLERKSHQIRELSQADFSKVSDNGLCKRFGRISALADDYYTRMWMVFLINEPLADAVFSTLKTHTPDVAEELLLGVSSPLKPNDAIRERQGLLRIALEKKTERRQNLLEHHARAFAHIPVFDFNHSPYPLEHFQKELAEIKHPQLEFDQIQKAFRRRRRVFPRRLSKLNLPKNGLKIAQIRMLSDLAYLRDYRDRLRQKMNLDLRNMYGEIARRTRMTITEVSFLSNDEIRILLAHPKIRPRLRTLAKQRQTGFSLEETPEEIKIKNGAPKTKQKSRTRKTGLQPIQGIAASPGTASGPVRIILTNLDLHKIKFGDVMIATMTRQDFVPYIRRCTALVTDEGGVTSHAAIICRELGIPCVVGTKKATKWLKDGQSVRADGNRGVVTTQ
ncbi:hypothetical protein HY994_03440 [Candidatus Micrarchaeota archaeon]|nr:hypothetical protein [Candidatus Micrarchaeota archaeon]